MPITAVRQACAGYQEARGLYGPIGLDTPHARALIDLIRTTFRVSADAARVRLIKLDLLAEQSRGASLFG
jgi:hypothetical protein